MKNKIEKSVVQFSEHIPIVASCMDGWKYISLPKKFYGLYVAVICLIVGPSRMIFSHSDWTKIHELHAQNLIYYI